MNKRIQITAALLAGMTLISAPSLHAFAAEEADAAAELVLPSGLTLQKAEQEIQDIGNIQVESLASAAVGIFQGDEILYTGYFGETDYANHIMANEDSVYEWGSISKTLIWVSTMQLWEQGRIDLDRDVREYLPEGFFQHLAYDEPITMLNLMNHNAGWQETFRAIFKEDGEPIGTLGEELQAIEPAQVHRPGEVAAYSNYGAAVAGYVIECITGENYTDYVHAHIFEPLGMEHTSIYADHSDNAWVAAQRKTEKSYRFTLGQRIDLGYCLDYIPCYPAGAAAGTLADLMTYAQALVDDAAPLFANPETQQALYAGTDFLGDSDIPVCAHGFWPQEYAVRVYGHSGGTTAGQSNMIYDLESKIGLVVLTNEPDGNSFLANTPEIVFGQLSPEKYGGQGTAAALHGYYLSARSLHTGMGRILPYLSALDADTLDGLQAIGGGVYQIAQDDAAMVFAEKSLADGTAALQLPSNDMVQERGYFAKLLLLLIYVLTAVAGYYLLRIRGKLKKHGKYVPVSGAAAMTAGHVAWLVSVLTMLAVFVVLKMYDGGVPYAAGVCMGVIQMVCAGVCAAAAVIACAAWLKTKQHALRYSAFAVCNAVLIVTVLYFELYKFWGL